MRYIAYFSTEKPTLGHNIIALFYEEIKCNVIRMISIEVVEGRFIARAVSVDDGGGGQESLAEEPLSSLEILNDGVDGVGFFREIDESYFNTVWDSLRA